MDKLGLYGQACEIWTKLENKNKLGQYGQNWTIRTNLDNMDKIGQHGQNWTIWSNCSRSERNHIGQHSKFNKMNKIDQFCSR